MSEQIDSQVYIDPEIARADLNLDLYKSQFQTLDADAFKQKQTRVVRKIARWKDPFTVPQSKVECVKWCSITPWDKWCCGHKLSWRWMYCDLYVEVRTGTEQDIVRALEESLQKAVVAAAIAAIVTAALTGGAALPAAKAAFVATLTMELSKKIEDLASVQLLQSCEWGDWE